MPKQKKISPTTSYDAIFERFTNNTLLKTDYSFIASMFRQWKGEITFIILKAKLNETIQTLLRNPKPATESQKDLGRLEGLEGALAIIDSLAKYDDLMPKEQKEEDDPNPDHDLANPGISIQNPD